MSFIYPMKIGRSLKEKDELKCARALFELNYLKEIKFLWHEKRFKRII